MKSIDFAQARSNLRSSGPPVVRYSFFIPDLTPDPEPAFVIPGRLAIGSQDCAFAENTRRRFTHVVNIGHGIPNAFPEDLQYLRIDVPDLVDFDPRPLFDKVHAFIDDALQQSASTAVLVHCQAGVSRSALMIISYLQLICARRGQNPSFELCYDQLKSVRSSAKPNVGFVQHLKLWEQELIKRFPAVLFCGGVAVKENKPQQINASPRVKLQRWISKLRFAWLLLRPLVSLCSLLVIVGAYKFGVLTKTKWLAFCTATLYNLYQLQQDAVFQANLFARLKHARPGVYFQPKMHQVMQPVLPATEYAAPRVFNLLGGDMATCAYVIANYTGARQVEYRRQRIVDSDGLHFTLDWAFPQSGVAATVCLLMAGIGGGSTSAYVKDVTNTLISNGFAVAVLLCNDGGEHTHENLKLDGMFNPSNDAEAQHAVQLLSKQYKSVLLVGFSLGGVGVCRLLSTSTSLPHNVLGGISISGSFKVDFISLPRYAGYYQSVLVAGLVDRIMDCFGAELTTRLPSMDGFLASSTYEHMHRELYVAAQLPNVSRDFVQWKQQIGSSPKTVARPLLFVTDLADPLHHCEHLGLNRLWDDKSSDDSISDNVAVVVTNGGGHVAWPHDRFTTEGYAYISNVVLEFAKSLVGEGEAKRKFTRNRERSE